MKNQISTISIAADEMKLCRFENILLRLGVSQEKTEQIANIFTQNRVDGLYTHGLKGVPGYQKYPLKLI